MKNYNYLFKYIIVGSTSVGKSCLLLQYVEQKFRDIHQVTMGVEFGTNLVHINSHVIKLHIWDTAGQESFSSMIKAYYRNAIGCILVFDLTDRKSFDALTRWHNDIMSCSGNEIQIIIVGNKNDLVDRREVQIDDGMKMASQFKGQYIEASALNGQNVVDIFEHLTTHILDSILRGKIDPTDDVSLQPIQTYGIKIGDFEKRRESETIKSSSRKQSVLISYPIQSKQQQCC